MCEAPLGMGTITMEFEDSSDHAYLRTRACVQIRRPIQGYQLPVMATGIAGLVHLSCDEPDVGRPSIVDFLVSCRPPLPYLPGGKGVYGF